MRCLPISLTEKEVGALCIHCYMFQLSMVYVAGGEYCKKEYDVCWYIVGLCLRY